MPVELSCEVAPGARILIARGARARVIGAAPPQSQELPYEGEKGSVPPRPARAQARPAHDRISSTPALEVWTPSTSEQRAPVQFTLGLGLGPLDLVGQTVPAEPVGEFNKLQPCCVKHLKRNRDNSSAARRLSRLPLIHSRIRHESLPLGQASR
jgi:hypothetical protein